jgi:hypothetical protein
VIAGDLPFIVLTDDSAAERHGFLDYVVRVLIFIGLLYGGAGVIRAIVDSFQIGPALLRLSWPRTQGENFATASFISFGANGLLDLLLLVACVAMLLRQPWGRKLAMVWAVAAIVCALLLHLLDAFVFFETKASNPAARATLDARHPGLAEFNSFMVLLQKLALPLLYAAVLSTPQVRSLFAPSAAGGFAVMSAAPKESGQC